LADGVQFADGIDTPDRLAFGLSAGQLAVVVMGVLAAYAIARSSLPSSVRIPLAMFVLVAASGLGWLRIAGRPALEWALFSARFVFRAREGALLVTPDPAAPGAFAQRAPLPTTPAYSEGDGSAGTGAVLRLFEPARASSEAQRARRVVFFSLKGGVGRTTLSVELACWLAAYGERWPIGERIATPLRVGLVDLDARSPSVAARLGIPQPVGVPRHAERRDPAGALGVRVIHRSGVQVITPVAHDPQFLGDGAHAHNLLADLDEDRFDVVVIDVAAELVGAAAIALQQADDILIVITPTVTGLHDAYRTTRTLRRAGFREHLACVVNRARADVDVSETVSDLGLTVVAQVPEDQGLVDAASSQRAVALDRSNATAAGIRAIGERVLAQLQI
jgi:MinD-like ATPase involved in chromosome partitioning or flagellar assembly